MSKTAARRVALLASSSLGLAAIASAASLGVALAPTAALAQATCTSGTAITNNGTNNVVIAGGNPNNPGITCLYVGDNALVSTAAATTVSTVAPGGGINLSATGTDDIAWNSTAGTVTGGNQTNGPVIEALTQAGNINITTAGVTGSQATITHGIYAESTGGGNINITASGAVSGSNTTTGIAAIEAISNGGDVTINTTSVSGRLAGILGRVSGSGDLTINTQFGSSASSGYGIDAVTGTGLLTINTPGNQSNTQGALRINTGGDAQITGRGYTANGAVNPTLDLIMNGAGSLTQVTVTNFLYAGTSSITDRLVLRASGAGNLELNVGHQPNVDHEMRGLVDTSGMTGDFALNLSGMWLASMQHTFGGASSVVTVLPGGVLVDSTSNMNNHIGDRGVIDPPTVFDFTASQDSRFVNQGMVVVGGVATAQDSLGTRWREGELRFEGLQTFENAGLIIMGVPKISVSQFGTPLGEGTDRWIDDMLVMEGGTFIGAEGSRIFLDAYLIRNQDACSPSIRVPEGDSQTDGDLPAADCVYLPGVTTEGVTNVLIHQIAQGDRGGTTKIVLVDVEGGTSAAGHFVLDPENRSYNPDQGGYIDLGYFIYPLVYDEDTQQHMLLGVAGANAWQTATWAVAAHDLWRVSTGSWFERQADLRGDLAEGIGGGVWLRTSGEFASREVAHSMMAGTSPFTFDNSHEQSTYAVTGGLDLLSGEGANNAWVVGLMAGYANSKLRFDASPNAGQFNGFTGGAYASWLAGGLFVDAALNANKLDIEMDMPALGLFPEDTLLATRLLSVGGQVEAGWRMPLAGTAFIEPLAGLSYVRTSWDDLAVASADPLREGVEVSFDDPASLRANVGARLGLDQRYGGWRAQYSVLGRLWNEFEGEHAATLFNIGDDVIVTDAFTGTITEFGVGVSVYGPTDAASGFFNFGGKFGDDYDSKNLSAGVRVNW